MAEQKTVYTADKEISDAYDPKRIPLVWVVLGFIFVQPVGMLLLGLRKRKNALFLEKEAKSMLTISIVFGILFSLTIFEITLSGDLMSVYLFGAPAVVAFVFSILMRQQAARYAKLKAAILNHNLTKIKDIATAVKETEQQTCIALKEMMQVGFFPHPELDYGAMVFHPNRLTPKPEQMQSRVCASCGATVIWTEGDAGVCEYCGASVNKAF